MPNSLRILLPLVVLSSCSTTPDTATSTDLADEFLQPNAIVRQEIDKRIRDIPFQHGDNLLANLLWLSERGEVAIPQLLGALENDEPKIRSSIAWVLGESHERRVIPRVRPLLEDEHESVRLEAARALMFLGDFSAAPTLITGLDSSSVRARYKCSEALQQVTGRQVPFDHLTDDQTARAESVLVWRQWWAEQSSDPFFHDSYATAHGLPTLDGRTAAERQAQGETPMPIDPSELPAQPAGDLRRPGQQPGQNQNSGGDSNSTQPNDVSNSMRSILGLGSAGSKESGDDAGTMTTTPVTEVPSVEVTPATPATGTSTTGTPTTEEKPATPASPFDWLRRKDG